jgi:hypothetical protein
MKPPCAPRADGRAWTGHPVQPSAAAVEKHGSRVLTLLLMCRHLNRVDVYRHTETALPPPGWELLLGIPVADSLLVGLECVSCGVFVEFLPAAQGGSELKEGEEVLRFAYLAFLTLGAAITCYKKLAK